MGFSLFGKREKVLYFPGCLTVVIYRFPVIFIL